MIHMTQQNRFKNKVDCVEVMQEMENVHKKEQLLDKHNEDVFLDLCYDLISHYRC